MRWGGVIGAVVAVGLLAFALRGVHPSTLAEHLVSARVLPLLGTAFFATLVFVVRTVRWRYILRLEGEALPYRSLWHATAIGFMANNLLPARTGEIARAFAAHRLTGVKFSTAAASIVVSRVMDGIAVVSLLAVAILFGGFDPATSIQGIPVSRIMTVAASGFVAVLVACIAVVHWPGPATNLVRKLAAGTLPARWADRPVAVFAGLVDGLAVLRDRRRFLAVTAWSFVVWGVNGLSFLSCTYAFTLNVPASAAFVLQSLIAFGVAIAPTPGYFGAFEVVSRETLTLYGVEAARAASYAVGYHVITFIPITLLGLYSLTRAQLHLADLRRERARQDVENPDAVPHGSG